MQKFSAFLWCLLFSLNVYGHDLGDGAHITTVLAKDPHQTASNPTSDLVAQWTLEITLQELITRFPEYDIDNSGRLESSEYGAIDMAQVVAYALQNLVISGDGNPCSIDIQQHEMVTHKRADYIQFSLAVACDSMSREIDVHYSLFFADNPYHQGTWTVLWNNQPSIMYFWEDERSRTFKLRNYSTSQVAWRFFVKGMHHIAIGYDHILFLVSLMLTAVLVRRHKKWQGVDQAPGAVWNLVKIITAFTVAHTITLSLAILDLVSLPPAAIVESIIAFSVLIMALNNLKPFIHRVFIVTFGFGLIHGFGFANVLLDYDLPTLELSVSLLSFDLGVEAGQLLIASIVFVPLLKMRRSDFYIRKFMPFVSFLILVIALFWLVERLSTI
ncbi:MAG: hypothetical protein CSA49_06245 [Gammaproteobacteria bacterium]|nr:MAG: hypothetical protein CSA49_06245 [Gammaproteobacteria bacterium]